MLRLRSNCGPANRACLPGRYDAAFALARHGRDRRDVRDERREGPARYAQRMRTLAGNVPRRRQQPPGPARQSAPREGGCPGMVAWREPVPSYREKNLGPGEAVLTCGLRPAATRIGTAAEVIGASWPSPGPVSKPSGRVPLLASTGASVAACTSTTYIDVIGTGKERRPPPWQGSVPSILPTLAPFKNRRSRAPLPRARGPRWRTGNPIGNGQDQLAVGTRAFAQSGNLITTARFSSTIPALPDAAQKVLLPRPPPPALQAAPTAGRRRVRRA